MLETAALFASDPYWLSESSNIIIPFGSLSLDKSFVTTWTIISCYICTRKVIDNNVLFMFHRVDDSITVYVV